MAEILQFPSEGTAADSLRALADYLEHREAGKNSAIALAIEIVGDKLHEDAPPPQKIFAPFSIKIADSDKAIGMLHRAAHSLMMQAYEEED